MSHYYSRIKGHRGEATRCGVKSSGITARADSWTIGGRVDIKWSNHLQTDVVTIYRTKGSDSYGSRIMSYAYINDKFTIIDTAFPELLI